MNQRGGCLADSRRRCYSRPFEYVDRKEAERWGGQSLLVFRSEGVTTRFQLLKLLQLGFEFGPGSYGFCLRAGESVIDVHALTSPDRPIRGLLTLFAEFLLLLVSEARSRLTQQNLQPVARAAYNSVPDFASQPMRKHGECVVEPLAE